MLLRNELSSLAEVSLYILYIYIYTHTYIHMPTRIPKTSDKWSAKISVTTRGVKFKSSSFIILHLNVHSVLSYIQKPEHSNWFAASKVRNNTPLRTRVIPHLFPSMTLFALFLNLFLKPGPCTTDFAKCNGTKISSLPCVLHSPPNIWQTVRILKSVVTFSPASRHYKSGPNVLFNSLSNILPCSSVRREEIFTPRVTWHTL